MIYAVIDTNVLVSALITHNPEAATAKVVRLLFDHGFVPMYDAEILFEYEEILRQKASPSAADLFLKVIARSRNVVRKDPYFRLGR